MEGVLWLHDLKKGHLDVVGEKALHLSELAKSGYPVPSAFVIPSTAFDDFLRERGIDVAIKNALKNIDMEDSISLQTKSEEIREMILTAEFPSHFKELFLDAYHNLNVNIDIFKMIDSSTLSMIQSGRDLPYVALRSSLASFDNSGVKPSLSLMNVRGNSNVLKAIQQSWADVYSVDAIKARARRGISPERASVALILQKQVNADKSGVIFTSHDFESGKGLIEAGYGLSQAILREEIIPDRYWVNKQDLSICDIDINAQDFMYTRDETMGRTKQMKLDDMKFGSRVLSQNEIQQLVKLGNSLEKAYGHPRDVEFALENGKAYILQTQPLFNLKKPYVKKDSGEKPHELEPPESGEPVITLETPSNALELFQFLEHPVQMALSSPHSLQSSSVQDAGEPTILTFEDIELKLPKDLDSIRKARRLFELLEEDLR